MAVPPKDPPAGGEAKTLKDLKPVLVVAERKDLLGQLADVVGRLGVKPDLALGVDFLPSDDPDDHVVVACLDSLEAYRRVQDHFGDRARVVALPEESADLEAVLRLLELPSCDHVLRREQGWEWFLLATLRKLLTGRVFGLEHYLRVRDPEIELLRFRSYRGRSAAIDRVVSYARKARFRRGQRENIAQATEELLMNALYHAPVDEEGRQVFAQVSPKDRLGQRSPKPVSVRYTVDGDRFLVAVRDRFGNLKKESVVRYLGRCVGSTVQIDTKTSGAGLGIYFVASRASVLVYNIAEGVATEAVALFERDRAPVGVPRLIGLFWFQGEGAREGS